MKASEWTWRTTIGLLASAARLVPVPLLDDALRTRAFQLLVSRSLRSHGRTYGSSAVPALYGGGDGCMSGCLGALAMLPIKLLLFPIRKILAYVLAAKSLARDLTEALLLGRVLDRHLESGGLSSTDRAALRSEAARVRAAFDNAMAGTDLGIVRAALSGALRSVPQALRAARRAVRKLRGSDGDPDLPERDRAELEAESDRVAKALDTPEIRAVLDRFDQRFDESLKVLDARNGSVRSS